MSAGVADIWFDAQVVCNGVLKVMSLSWMRVAAVAVAAARCILYH